jgi:hypothetical protein
MEDGGRSQHAVLETSANIGSHVSASNERPAAGDQRGGPFHMTGLRGTNAGTKTGDEQAYNF